MKKLLLVSLLALSAAGAKAQSKSTGTVALLTGMTAALELNNTTSVATLTLTGPSDRWFALQFGAFADGQGMQQGQDMVYFNGTTLIDGTMNGIGNFPSADTNNWTVTSNAVAGTTRTIVATRSFTGGANDYVFNYNNTTIDFAYSRSSTASFALANHGSNRGYRFSNAFSPVLASDVFNLEQSLTVHPNPSSGIINISTKNVLAGVTVINLLGQEVISKQINSNTAAIDLAGLTAGTYIFKVTATDGQTASVRVVKQ